MTRRDNHGPSRFMGLGAALLLASCQGGAAVRSSPPEEAVQQVIERCQVPGTQVTYEETESGGVIILTNPTEVDKARCQAQKVADLQGIISAPAFEAPMVAALGCPPCADPCGIGGCMPLNYTIDVTPEGARVRIEPDKTRLRKFMADLANRLRANGGDL